MNIRYKPYDSPNPRVSGPYRYGNLEVNKTKYRIGDIVRIREDIRQNDALYMEGSTTIGAIVTTDMLEFRGLDMEIRGYDSGMYKLKGDCRSRFWSDGMFEGLADNIQLSLPANYELQEFLEN